MLYLFINFLRGTERIEERGSRCNGVPTGDTDFPRNERLTGRFLQLLIDNNRSLIDKKYI